jgi:nucleoside-diphosphate-sugar epimerase
MGKKKNVVMTGAHGFIGTHLSAALVDKGFSVCALERELFTDPEALKNKLEELNPQYIYHLGAYGNHSAQTDIDQIVAANIFNTFLLLRQSREINYKAFINFSTSSVNLPHQTFYSASKSAAEKLCTAFRQQYGKPVVSVRPASVYGPGEAYFRFIPTLIKHLEEGTKMTLVENATHSWIYVGDFVQGVLKVAKNAAILDNPINISDGDVYPNIDIVHRMEKITGKILDFESVERMRDYDTEQWVVGNYELKQLGYKPENTIQQGLFKTYEATQRTG